MIPIDHSREPLQNLLESVGAVFKGKKCCCIFHEDRHASAGIYEKNGAWRYKCQVCGAGGDLLDIQKLLGEQPASPGKLNGSEHDKPTKIVKLYDYTDEGGTVLFQKVRYEPKGFSLRRPNGKSGYISGLGNTRRVLYMLPGLIAASAETIIWLVEGEKDADNVRATGLVATTNVEGASKPGQQQKWDSSYTEVFRGRIVGIIADKDEPGRARADYIARQLVTVAAEVRVLEVPGNACKDVSDFLSAGGDAEQLLAVFDAAPIYTTRADDAPLAGNETDKATQWPAPLRLPDDLPPVLPFDYALLPAPFAGWIRDIAERMQCPPDYCAVAAMVAAGSLIGRKVGIHPKARDDWMELANLWGFGIGRPSVMKSPPIQEALKSLTRLEREAAREHALAMKDHKVTQMITAEKKKLGSKQIKDALENGLDAASVAKKILEDEEGTEPVRVRYMTNDSTVEKLGMILADNPNGILVYRDEVIAFLRTMDREGHEGDRGFYLEAWNGKGRFTYDRVGRGTIDIEAAICSLFGSIQPGPLQEYLRGAVAGGQGDDGFMQRFQLAVWPDVPPNWRNVDRYPEANAKDAAHDVFKRLAGMKAEDVGAVKDKYDPDGIPCLRFNAEAQQKFDAWRVELEKKLRSGTDHPAIEAHLAKYRKLVPALALIIELVEGASVGFVSATSLAKAISWATYLESHARRIYAGVTKAAHLSARALAGRIEKGEVKDKFALRDLYRNGWTLLCNREDALAACDVLVSLNWIHERTMPTGGRDRTIYLINPAVQKKSETLREGTDKTDKSPPAPPSVSFVSSGSGASLVSGMPADDSECSKGEPQDDVAGDNTLDNI